MLGIDSTMMRLSNFTQGRDNNFNLIRLSAALAVLVSHSFVLVSGHREAAPLLTILGMHLGNIAVDIFFIISGFLVTGSLLSRQSTIEFVWARLLRIYPALIVMVLLSVFLLGLFFTTIPATSFLRSHETHVYMLQNMTLVSDVAYTLPGVFESLPMKKIVNGSLWTMPYEILLYMMLAILWLAFGLVGSFRLQALKSSVLLLAVVSFFAFFADHLVARSESDFSRLFFMFFTGAAYYVLKERIVLSYWFFAFALAGLLASVIDKKIFFVVYILLLAYILFFLAYVPAGRIRNFSRIGDYSYGVYIYAFPVQQSIAAIIPGVSVIKMLVLSSTATLIIAALSWNLIEKHALRLKSSSVHLSRRMLHSYLTKLSTRWR